MSDFKIPESIEGLSLDELTALAADARAAGAALTADKSDADFTDADLETASALLDFIASVDGAITEAEEAAAKRADAVANLRAGFEAPEEAPAKEETKVEAAAETTEPEKKVEEPVVAAAPRTPVTSEAAAAAPEVKVDEEPTAPRATIVAAVDVPGVAAGSDMTMLDVAKAAMTRFDRMPKPGSLPAGIRQEFGVAQIRKGRSDDLNAIGKSGEELQELIAHASDEKRLEGGSLTAAAGWCAPSETVYDLCANETTDGIWDLPELAVSRGGLNFTKGPDFGAIYALGGFHLTEAQVEAQDGTSATDKPCFAVPCPDFTDVRLDAVGICITAGLLQRRGYPEIIDRVVQGALIAHQHRVAATLIAKANTIAGAAVSLTNVFPNALSILHALELVAQGERQRYRLSRTQTLEVILPFWVKSAIRADLANRTGVELTNVTDGDLDAHFATRGLRVQFIYNYQELAYTGGVAADYPATLEALVYPAGTFTKLTDDVINLSTVYDSTNLKQNAYTALFFEEGVNLANTCWAPRRISLALSVSGLTGAANINQDWRSPGPLNAVPVITVTA